ncbi:cysteine hydrolase family protein [Cohnella sp. GCM10012308]|uniref:cysteine hydrolase family protein n=1 Tax=Cohnella sp. GCM10012308 TaxID=3317329 RepID=UPI003612C543
MDLKSGKTALLVMDMQQSIVARYAMDEERWLPFQTAVRAAREHGVQVIYIRLAFREGYPEVHPGNKMFAGIAQYGGATVADAGTQILDEVRPEPGEPVVTKIRVSAFAGSGLDVLLRARGIDSLVLCGVSTSGVVLSTLREAADRDFTLTVLSDACLDADPEVHRVLTEKVFPRQAEVLTVGEWASRLL